MNYKIAIAAAVLLSSAVSGQRPSENVPAAVLIVAARHVDNVIPEVGIDQVSTQQIRLAPSTEIGADLVRRVGRALGIEVRPKEELISCDAFLRCRSTDGSAAGFSFITAEVTDGNAVILMEVWVFPPSEDHLYRQVDRLYLSKSGGKWLVTRVERVSET